MTNNIINKKVFIFDLDDTLYLHSFNRNKEYLKFYHSNIRKWLYNLKKNGKIIGLITYNTNPRNVLKDLGVNENIFDFIEYPENILREYFDNNRYKYIKYDNFIFRTDGKGVNYVSLIENKKDMIERNISKYNKKDIIFFDDSQSNILSVRRLGIECILVDPSIGIEIQKI
jgi:HAD superfamily phosphatase (TIGR01681 family)